MQKLAIISAFLSLIITPVFALTLDEAITLAQQNHPQISVAQSSLGGANARQNSAITNFLPTVGASYTEVDRDIKTGGAATTTQYRASFNLFRGFGDIAAQRSANWTKTARRYEFLAAKADVALQTKQAFFGYLKAKDSLGAAEAQLKLAQKQDDDAEAFFAQGLIGVYEKRQFALELLQNRQAKLQAQSDFQVARLTLESVIGAALESEPNAVLISRLSAADRANLRAENMRTTMINFDALDTLNREQLLVKMEQNRSELAALQAAVNAQKAQKTSAFSAALPSVDIAVAKEYYGYDSGFSGNDEQTLTTLTASWQLSGLVKPYYEREAAHYEQKTLESRLTDTKRQLRLQLAVAHERFLLAKEAFEVAKNALAVAAENAQIVKNRFDAQLSSASELIDAYALHNRAEAQWTTYYYDQLLAFSELERVTESDLTQEIQ